MIYRLSSIQSAGFPNHPQYQPQSDNLNVCGTYTNLICDLDVSEDGEITPEKINKNNQGENVRFKSSGWSGVSPN